MMENLQLISSNQEVPTMPRACLEPKYIDSCEGAINVPYRSSEMYM